MDATVEVKIFLFALAFARVRRLFGVGWVLSPNGSAVREPGRRDVGVLVGGGQVGSKGAQRPEPLHRLLCGVGAPSAQGTASRK